MSVFLYEFAIIPGFKGIIKDISLFQRTSKKVKKGKFPAINEYLLEMTVRAGVHDSSWNQIDYAAVVTPFLEHLKRCLPFLLIAVIAVSAAFFAISCKGSTVAFNNGSRLATLNIEVAGTASERSRGLSDREALPADSAMLFDFGSDTTSSFYMKDTSIPLSIAFIDSSGKVLAIEDMKPFDITPVGPPEAYRYAIEANKGWFEEHGVKPGSRATIDI